MKRKEFMKKAVGCLIAALLITGCGGNTQNSQGNTADQSKSSENVSESTENTTDNDTDSSAEDGGNSVTTDSEKSTEAQAESSDSDDISGKWVLVYTSYHSEYKDGDVYDNITMAQDDEALNASFDIQEKDGKYITNHKYDYYETTLRVFGNELIRYEEPAYDGCANSKWCYGFSGSEDDDVLKKKLTRVDDMLLTAYEYSYEDDEYGYSSVTTDYYLREDSPKLKDQDSLRYFDTVTVDNAESLLNEIGNNKKIILKAGVYNMSGIPKNTVGNKYVQNSGYDYTISGVSNLALEAEDGAEVQIVIGEAYSPVLNFDYCSNVRLKGLTVGHEVEPGYCSGSVLYFQGSSGVKVENCKLYGSGTYGIEADSLYNLEVENTDIYECTYGMLSLRNSGNLSFNNCKFHDCRDMSMICLSSMYSITFENCEFTDNVINSNNCYFVEMSEYDDVIFKKCTFKGNEYNNFSNYNVTMEDCSVEDTERVSGDIITMSDINNSVDLVDLYDKAVAKQSELDKEINGDKVLDQQTLNSLSYEKFYLWDALINKIWSYLGGTLSEEEMEQLTQEQRKWINDKEAAAQEAAKPFEGGSMELMIEYGVGAEWTQKRVEYLIDKYIRS
ncbi:right-handed parallel beta-helix repeat-containing protein [Butyrivibrio sp. JL13D10]|uniref:right-handed parallel beta-helix repeat-containing protein n=1 Tax=Butyrivibrio sp. JL13D10 TaxID=3236815 RepID=UPI0038B490D6